jgi:hypothetical protein
LGGVGPMMVDFGECAINHNSVPCTRLVLETLLRDAGFIVTDGMVQGLVLSVDLEAILMRSDHPEPGEG